MAYKLPAHLHRNRLGILYFRLTIPRQYRRYIGVNELYRSLGTASVREAAALARSLYHSLQCAFSAIDSRAMSKDEKTPAAPPVIDPASLRTTLKHAKERHRQIDRIEELDRTVTELHRQRVQQQTQHKRELAIAIRTAAAVAPASPVTPPASPLLSKAVEAFIKEKTTLARWTPKTLEKKQQAFRLFAQFMRERLARDVRLNEIDKGACVDFLALLQTLPPNITKTHAGAALGDVAALGLPPMASATINGITGLLSGFFEWCKQNPSFKMDHNPAYRLAIEEKPTKKLRAFKDDELAALLSSNAFTSRTFLHPYQYWLIPLALYTGARLGELCQLALSDFVDVQGIPCIDINDEEEGKRLKNRNSRRLVPVHSTLIELGLLRYVEVLGERGETRLFPEIDLSISASHTASKWFNDKGRYSDSCGVQGKETNFHSFRRTFITRTIRKTDGGGGADPHDIAPIVGHEHGLVTLDVYFDGREDARERRLTMEKFQLPTQVRTLIPPVEAVAFGVQPPRTRRNLAR